MGLLVSLIIKEKRKSTGKLLGHFLLDGLHQCFCELQYRFVWIWVIFQFFNVNFFAFGERTKVVFYTLQRDMCLRRVFFLYKVRLSARVRRPLQRQGNVSFYSLAVFFGMKFLYVMQGVCIPKPFTSLFFPQRPSQSFGFPTL